MKNKLLLSGIVVLAFGTTTVVRASLNPVGIWTGNVGLSIDAVGSNSSPEVGDVQAEIPTGSTILAAYLYSAGTPFPYYPSNGGPASPTTLAEYNSSGITLAGNAVTFSAMVGASAFPARPNIGNWFTARAEVTSLVTALAGTGGSFSWAVTEGALNTRIDGEVLAIVYKQAGLPESSVVLLDGGMNTSGETTTVNFGAPLGDVSAPGFFADMSLAASFSYQPPTPPLNPQFSAVIINSTPLTFAAGGYDDGTGVDGALITAGGIGDSNANPTVPTDIFAADDDELYSLKPFLSAGDTSFVITSINPSNDDNVFMMGLHISAPISQVNDTPAPPPPGNGVPDSGTTLTLLTFAMGGLAAVRRGLARA